jgi:signal transduction histidine kinase/ligand-binding sensor domain-containing protein
MKGRSPGVSDMRRILCIRTLVSALGCLIALLAVGFGVAAAVPAPAPSRPGCDVGGRVTRFERLSIEQGLSENTVIAILQDHQGWMWFATREGLNRYDGYEFTVYEPDPQDPASLSNGFITALYEDRSGVLWVGTLHGGLNRFDRATETFTRYLHDPEDPTSLSHNRVRAIYQDRDGTLWIGTHGGGLSRFAPETGAFTHYQHDPGEPASLSNNVVRAIYQDRSGTLWIGTYGGLNAFDPTAGTFTRYLHDPDDPHSLGEDLVMSIGEDGSGALWAATYGHGLERLDRATGRFEHFTHDPDDPHSLSDDEVNVVFTDRSGTLWVGTESGGLNQQVLGADGNTSFEHYVSSDRDPHSLSHDAVRAICEDQGGVLWIGTYGGGISKLNRATQAFGHYRRDPDDPNSLIDNAVMAFFEDEGGGVWIGTAGGLDYLDFAAQTFAHYVHDPDDPHSLSDNRVWSIHQDRAGIVWAGTMGGVLNRLDPATGVFDHYQHDPDDPHSLPHYQVAAIHEDAGGRLWVGTYGGGLSQLDRATGAFTHYRHDPDDPHSLRDNAVLAIHEDHAGILWIGTESGGLARFDRAAGTFTSYTYSPDDPQGLSHNGVAAIHEDREGVLWIGTLGGGLNRFDRATQVFTHYRQQDGLPGDRVLGILEDGGSLWLSTSNGLSRFDPRSGVFHNYDASDGLQSSAFGTGAYHQGVSGRMYFGGLNGFNAFHSAHIQDNAHPPPMAITAFKKFNETVETHVPADAHIALSYRDNFIAFEFAALDYAAPHKNQYAYRLEGFDPDWVYAGTRRYASYTNLRGGRYTFRVRGSNNHGVWNEEGMAVRITVAPPFWQTMWFWGAALLTLAGGLLGAYRLRVKGIEAHSRQLERQVTERTREIEQRTQQLTALYRADEELYRHLDLDHVLQALVDIAVDILQADKSSLLIWDAAREELVVRVARGFQPETLSTMTFARGEGAIGQVIVTGQPLMVEDTHADERVARHVTEPEGIRSLMHVPLEIGGRMFGVFNVDYVQPRVFGEDEVRLFTSLAQRAALAIENAQLYEQSQQVAVMEERNRLARELHDSVSQALYGIALGARTARTLLERELDGAEVKGKLDHPLDYVLSLAEAGLTEMRALILELRPDALEREGLVAALQRQAAALRVRHELDVQAELGEEPDLPLDVKEALYRIAQEALNNVLKHAQASRVTIRLWDDAGDLVLQVQDDGVGFDPTKEHPGHLGLRSMQERTARMGGRLEIESAPHCGALLRVCIPRPILPRSG